MGAENEVTQSRKQTKRVRVNDRHSIIEASALEFAFRVNMCRLNNPEFGGFDYLSQFCHERCIGREELALELVRMILNGEFKL